MNNKNIPILLGFSCLSETQEHLYFFFKGLLALSVDFAHFLASSWIFISLLGPMSGMGMNMGMEGQWHYM